MFDLLPDVWIPVVPIAEIETQPMAIEFRLPLAVSKNAHSI
jgi:hypothetical protein